jgi:tetraacyldisaccharide 4'-kinase
MSSARFPTHPAARLLLGGPALLYTHAMALRNRWYDRPGTTRKVNAPVISVGNLTVGGTGKTPVVEAISRILLNENRKPAIISRGYGGTAGKGPLVVSRGQGPEVLSTRCGDEPFQLAGSIPELIVVVGSDRFSAAREAIALGADVLVLDDGFQHRRLHRDLDICLLDACNPAVSEKVLPAGPLRESFSGISRAGLIVLTRAETGIKLDSTQSAIRRWNTTAPVISATHVPVGFITSSLVGSDPPDKAFAFCGIASPESFRKTLNEMGVVLTGFQSFQDHHRFDLSEILKLREDASREGATLVTTEKDLARLSGMNLPAEGPLLLALKIGVSFHEKEIVIKAIRETIRQVDEP